VVSGHNNFYGPIYIFDNKVKMKKIQLLVHTHTLGLIGTMKEIQAFDMVMKRVVKKLEQDDFFGSCRVFTESSDGMIWELRIVTPPIPSNHRLNYMLEAVLITSLYDKRVYSSCSQTKEAMFELGKD
jgi:hypothetical protein